MRKKTIARYAIVIGLLTLAYTIFWLTTSGKTQELFERYAVAVCTVLGIIMGGFISVAFIAAQKTRLNFACFVLCLAIAMLFGLSIAPNSLGVLWYHAPTGLNRPRNEYALFVIPAWLRVWMFLIFTAAMAGVIVEFYKANWIGPLWRSKRKRKQEVPESWQG